jgi:hypothetical protein
MELLILGYGILDLEFLWNLELEIGIWELEFGFLKFGILPRRAGVQA